MTILEAGKDIIDLLKKAGESKCSITGSKVGDIAIVDSGVENATPGRYFRVGRVMVADIGTTLDRGYNINITVLPRVEVLRAPHTTRFGHDTPPYLPREPAYILNETEIASVKRFFEDVELQYLRGCL